MTRPLSVKVCKACLLTLTNARERSVAVAVIERFLRWSVVFAVTLAACGNDGSEIYARAAPLGGQGGASDTTGATTGSGPGPGPGPSATTGATTGESTVTGMP